MKHVCHLPGCNSGCPAAHLFCGKHWAMVPDDLKREVYATVKQRDKTVNKTWAAWWRAQAQATVAVLRKAQRDEPGVVWFAGDDEAIKRWETREMAFAETLEAK